MKRDIRYRIADAPQVKVVVHPDDHREDDCVYSARLLDLSKNGAKLFSEFEIPTGKSIRLGLVIADLGMDFNVAGGVCWSRPWKDVWFFGCRLGHELPDGLFDRLTSGGQLDRRADPRLDEATELSVTWHASKDSRAKTTPITLRNYSPGGFCVVSTKPVVVGQEMKMHVDGQRQIVIAATAQWQLDTADGFLIGCTYVEPRDYERLDEMSGSVVLPAHSSQPV